MSVCVTLSGDHKQPWTDSNHQSQTNPDNDRGDFNAAFDGHNSQQYRQTLRLYSGVFIGRPDYKPVGLHLFTESAGKSNPECSL